MNRLKVAFVAGTLGLGGAEKQLVYMSRALQESGVQVRVYCLTKGEYYESALKEIGLCPFWIGKIKSPFWRLLSLAVEMRDFRPHIIQSSHFYVNLYVALVSTLYKALGIGSIRSNAINEGQANGFWGMKLLNTPHAIILNSHSAKKNAVSLGALEDRLFVLPNAIDLMSFDKECIVPSSASMPFNKNNLEVNILVVGNLFPEKRFDLFLLALHKAQVDVSTLRGFIVGDGEEKKRLKCLAEDLALLPDGVRFLGRNDNIPALLGQADLFVLTSDFEGMPNVILEAMAAHLPVITTPAGDAEMIVKNGESGFVVPFGDVDMLAARMVELAVSPELRYQMGDNGRKRVEKHYCFDLLGARLLNIYRVIARKKYNRQLLEILETD